MNVTQRTTHVHHSARLSPPGFVDKISRKQLLSMQLSDKTRKIGPVVQDSEKGTFLSTNVRYQYISFKIFCSKIRGSCCSKNVQELYGIKLEEFAESMQLVRFFFPTLLKILAFDNKIKIFRKIIKICIQKCNYF